MAYLSVVDFDYTVFIFQFQQLNCGKKRKRKGAWDIAQIIDVNEKDTIAEIHEYRKKMASQEDSNYIPPVKTVKTINTLIS